jgi:hypothetical protein
MVMSYFSIRYFNISFWFAPRIPVRPLHLRLTDQHLCDFVTSVSALLVLLRAVITKLIFGENCKLQISWLRNFTLLLHKISMFKISLFSQNSFSYALYMCFVFFRLRYYNNKPSNNFWRSLAYHRIFLLQSKTLKWHQHPPTNKRNLLQA